MSILPQLSTLIYSTLVIAGGVFGYVYANSFASIIMGSLFGVSLIVSAALWIKKIQLAKLVAMASTLFLFFFFLLRFLLTKAFLPSGLMALLSVSTFCIQYFSKQGKAKKKAVN